MPQAIECLFATPKTSTTLPTINPIRILLCRARSARGRPTLQSDEGRAAVVWILPCATVGCRSVLVVPHERAQDGADDADDERVQQGGQEAVHVERAVHTDERERG